MRAVTLNYLSTGSGTDQTDHSAETGSLAERPLDELIACHGHILLMLKPVCDGAEAFSMLRQGALHSPPQRRIRRAHASGRLKAIRHEDGSAPSACQRPFAAAAPID